MVQPARYAKGVSDATAKMEAKIKRLSAENRRLSAENQRVRKALAKWYADDRRAPYALADFVDDLHSAVNQSEEKK